MAPKDSGSPKARLQAIREIERSKGAAAAEKALVEYIRTEAPTSWEAFLGLSRLLLKGKRVDDALRAAQKSSSLAPLEVDPFVMIGLVQFRAKNIPAAGDGFARALALDSANPRALLGAAAVKLADEDFAEAEHLVDKVIDRDPTMMRAHELAARVQMKQGKTEEALDELRLIIQKFPKNRRALRAYLGVLKKEGRIDEAVPFLEAGVEADPGSRDRQRMLTAVAARTGRMDLAAGELQAKVEGGEANRIDLVRLAMTYIQGQAFDEARAVIAQLETKRGLKPVMQKLEGDIAMGMKDYPTAASLYREACRSARVDALDEASVEGAEDPAKLARAWKAHAATSIREAVRSRRSARADAAETGAAEKV